MTPPADLRSVTLVLTASCNLGCTYCYQDASAERAMDAATLRGAVDLLLGSRSEEITLEFQGGEPLLAFRLLREAVEHAEAACPPGKRLRLGLCTNGTLLDDERVEFLERHGVTTRLSFDGVAPAQELRAPGTFRLLDRRLDRLREGARRFFREHLQVAMTLAPGALESFPDSVEYFLAKDVRTINLSPALGSHSRLGPEAAALLERQFLKVFHSCRRHLDRTGRVPLTLFRKARLPGGGLWRPGPVCAGGDGTSLAVDVDGRVGVCAALAESRRTLPAALAGERHLLRLGRLSDPSFAPRLRERLALLRESGLFEHRADRYSRRGPCRECPQRDACLVCPIAHAEEHPETDPRRVPDFTCAFNRIALDLRDRFPAAPYTPALLRGLGSPPPPLRRL